LSWKKSSLSADTSYALVKDAGLCIEFVSYRLLMNMMDWMLWHAHKPGVLIHIFGCKHVVTSKKLEMDKKENGCCSSPDCEGYKPQLTYGYCQF
jgi:hypothetical protein